jgi:hypothetical protein
MKTKYIIAAGLVATTAFTLFSYALSKALNKNFKEPELLGNMLDALEPAIDNDKAIFTGWVMHYVVGCGIAAGYSIMLKNTTLQPSVKNGLIVGAITGIPAVRTWDTFLKVHPMPPRTRSLNYYIQLVAGHAIFGAATFYIFSCFSQKK